MKSRVCLSHTVAGVTYSWPGELGLAPSWAAGAAIRFW
jgi:hypothetical protein